MRIRIAFACLLLLSAAPLRADAAPARYLTLRGSGTASVEVRFTAAVTVHMSDDETARTAPRVTTSGTYAGAWIEPADRSENGTGFYRVPAFDSRDGVPFVMGMDAKPVRLAAGRYRVFLVTDGRSEVRVQVDGLPRDLKLTPRHAELSYARLADVRAKRAEMAGQRTLTFRVNDGSRTMLAAWVDAPGAPSVTSSICLDSRAQVPCPFGGQRSLTGGPGDWLVEWWHFGVGWLPSTAEQDVQFTQAAAGASPPDDLLAFVVTFGGRR